MNSGKSFNSKKNLEHENAGFHIVLIIKRKH